MTAAVRRWPPALRVGSVVVLFTAFAVVFLAQWVQQREADAANLRLYERCLDSAQDLTQVRECATGYYVRRDGRSGGADDPLQIARAQQRLEQLRVVAAGAVPEVAGTPSSTTGPGATPDTATPTDHGKSADQAKAKPTEKAKGKPTGTARGKPTDKATPTDTARGKPTDKATPTDTARGKPTDKATPTDESTPSDKARGKPTDKATPSDKATGKPTTARSPAATPAPTR